MKKPIIFCAVLFITLVSKGQFLFLGQDPGNLTWYQINTPHFRLIYPEDFRGHAQRLANIFEHSYLRVNKTLPSDIPFIPVIMHSHSSISNGMTAWAPRRIELFPIPYQGIYTHHWYEQLAIHEFRHICQFNILNTGFTAGASFLFGEAATAVVGSFIPQYFYEGDAVLTETALSRSGRGRQPYFQMETRAYLLEKKRYSYRKAMLGSYRNHIPNHYQFGYLYVASIRNKYGFDIWEKTMRREGTLPGFFAYNFGLFNHTGQFSGGLYRESFRSLDTLWRQQDKDNVKTDFDHITLRRNHIYTNYNFPQVYKDSIIIAEKSGINNITQFVKIYPNGHEKRIKIPGNYNSDNLSVSGSLMAWNEYIPDPRWQHRNYSVIRTMNLETEKSTWLTSKTKYFYPVVSPDATKIAVIEYMDLTYSITIINSSTGVEINKFFTPDHLFPMNPCWDENGKTIYVILNSDSGKKIVSLNTEDGSWKQLYYPRFQEMFQLSSKGEWIYFRSGYSGIENIYALNKNTLKVFQVTSSRFGAFDPSVENDRLLYSDYSSDGFSIASIKPDSTSWKPISGIVPNMIDLNEFPVLEEGEVIDSASIPKEVYAEKKYSKLGHLFKFHTWTPFYYDWTKLSPSPYPVFPGFTVFSQNELGTAGSYAGAAYGLIRKEPFYFGGITYYGFYPVINVEGSYGGDQLIVKDPDYNSILDTLPSQNFITRLYLPLNFSRGAFTNLLQPEAGFQYTNTKIYKSRGEIINGYGVGYFRLQGYSYLKKAVRDLTPRFGIGVNATILNAILNPKYFGSYYSAIGHIYLPGILKHQSISFTSSSEKVLKENFRITGTVRPARGYDYDSSFLKKTQGYNKIYKFSFDYYTPLLYPDLNLINIMYVKRLWAIGFYDISTGSYFNDETHTFNARTHQSYGAEIYMDFHFLHFFFPITIGYRFAVLPEANKTVSHLIFSTTLTNF